MGGAKLLVEGSGGRLRPQWVQGKALVGGPGGHSPPEALGFILAFRIVGVKTNYSTKEIVVFWFFLKGWCTCTCGTPLATAFNYVPIIDRPITRSLQPVEEVVVYRDITHIGMRERERERERV